MKPKYQGLSTSDGLGTTNHHFNLPASNAIVGNSDNSNGLPYSTTIQNRTQSSINTYFRSINRIHTPPPSSPVSGTNVPPLPTHSQHPSVPTATSQLTVPITTAHIQHLKETRSALQSDIMSSPTPQASLTVANQATPVNPYHPHRRLVFKSRMAKFNLSSTNKPCQSDQVPPPPPPIASIPKSIPPPEGSNPYSKPAPDPHHIITQ